MIRLDHQTHLVNRWLVMWRFDGRSWNKVRVIPGLTWFSRIARTNYVPRLRLPSRNEIFS